MQFLRIDRSHRDRMTKVGKNFRPSFGVIKPDNQAALHRPHVVCVRWKLSGAGDLGKFFDHPID